MNYVFVCYPIEDYITRDADGFARRGMALDTCVEMFSRGLNVPEQKLWDRFRLYNALIDEYRSEGRRVAWGLFDQEPRLGERIGIPDMTRISPLFDVRAEDIILPVGVTKRQLDTKPSQYPEAQRVIQQLPDAKDIVFGGFHEDDCVRRYHEAAQEIGISSRIDRYLTVFFFDAMTDSFHQDFWQNAMNKGHLDPVMHEDDPLEELRRPFEGRLDGKLHLLVPQRVVPGRRARV